MTRFRSGTTGIVALSFLVFLVPEVAIGGEPANEAAGNGVLTALELDKSLPYLIGGAITVGVLLTGFFLLNARRPEHRSLSGYIDSADQLPPDVVPGPNPLRYLAVPAVFLVLLAVAIPTGLSIWNGLPGGGQLMMPRKQDPLFTPGSTLDLKFAPVPAVKEIPLKGTPIIPIPQPIRVQQMPVPPVRMPTMPAAGPPRR